MTYSSRQKETFIDKMSIIYNFTSGLTVHDLHPFHKRFSKKKKKMQRFLDKIPSYFIKSLFKVGSKQKSWFLFAFIIICCIKKMPYVVTNKAPFYEPRLIIFYYITDYSFYCQGNSFGEDTSIAAEECQWSPMFHIWRIFVTPLGILLQK